MSSIAADIRHAVRSMLRAPVLTTVAILTLAAGIGANTSIFSVVYALMLAPPPYADPDRLAMLMRFQPGDGVDPVNAMPWSYPKFQRVRDEAGAIVDTAAVAHHYVSLSGAGEPERVSAEAVSANYFELLGVEPAIGRGFRPEENGGAGQAAVAVLSHSLWQRRFGAASAGPGETITINTLPFTVIGVMAEGFRGTSGRAELWTPVSMMPALTGITRRLAQPHAHWHEVVARLRPGVTIEGAQAAMPAVSRQLDESFAAAGLPAEHVRLVPIAQATRSAAIDRALLVLLGAVALVLLITTVNIANLTLARAASRRREIAIRLALGAGRGRVTRLLLTESLVLAGCGGLAGLLVASWGVDLLNALKPQSASLLGSSATRVFDAHTFGLGWAVLSFNVALAALAGILCGLAPAVQASRRDVADSLKDGSLQAGADRSRRPLARSGHVVVQVALAVVLLAGAGLMIRTFARLWSTDAGFVAEGVLTAKIDLPRQKYRGSERAAAFFDAALERLREVPAIRSASLATATPLSSNFSVTLMRIEGAADTAGGGAAAYHMVGSDYFRVMGVPVIRGRGFTDRDRSGSPRVAVISQSAARRYWPGRDPIGSRIFMGVGWEPESDRAEIVGIVGDVRYGSPADPLRPDVYLAYPQFAEESAFLVVRTAGDPRLAADGVRRAVQSLDPLIPLYDLKTMTERAGDALSRPRFVASLLGAFAVMALILAAIGIAGVLAYTVAGRTREIGIRIALGARPGQVVRLVLGDGMLLAGLGLAFGLAGAWLSSGLLAAELHGVTPTDAVTFGAVPVVVLAAAALASYLPARRAARVDPLVALRAE
jgi:predicted permease